MVLLDALHALPIALPVSSPFLEGSISGAMSSHPQDPLQPPAGLPSHPGRGLLAGPAASLSLQPLQLLGRPGVLQGGPAHPPGERGGCVWVEGCHVRGQRTGPEWGLYTQRGPLKSRQKASLTPTLDPK